MGFTDLAWASFLLSQSKRMKRRKVLRLVQRKAENLVPVKKQINLKNHQEIRVLKIRKGGERRSTMMIIIMKKINLIILRSITVRRKGQVQKIIIMKIPEDIKGAEEAVARDTGLIGDRIESMKRKKSLTGGRKKGRLMRKRYLMCRTLARKHQIKRLTRKQQSNKIVVSMRKLWRKLTKNAWRSRPILKQLRKETQNSMQSKLRKKKLVRNLYHQDS